MSRTVEYVEFEGLRLPPPPLRFGPRDLGDDRIYLLSAEAQARRLVQECQPGPQSSVLDFGSGQGRLAFGLLRRFPDLREYLGVDVHAPSVRWCQAHITSRHPSFRFALSRAPNARYNPTGTGGVHLPVDAAQFDAAFVNSVFTHMLEDDVRASARELARALKPGARAYLTAFLERDVPPVAENPEGYLAERGPARGPLHRVRYEIGFFRRLFEEAGFDVVRWTHRSEKPSGQSALVVRCRDRTAPASRPRTGISRAVPSA